MNGFEIYGRLIMSTLGLGIVCGVFLYTFSRAKYLSYNWLAWFVFVILIIVGLVLAYKPMQRVFFRK